MKSYNYIEYKYSGKGFEIENDYSAFEGKIHEYIESILKREYDSYNAVSDFISKTTSTEKGVSNKQFISNSAYKNLLKISPHDYKGLEIAISYYKDSFPWISDFGKELITGLNSDLSNEEKSLEIERFLDVLYNTFTDPELIKYYSKDKAYQKNFSQNYIILKRYLSDLKNDLIGEK